MRFSLIVATLGRTAELERLLNSLDRQSYSDFELIVVDQNPDDRLAGIMEKFRKSISITRLLADPGLSRARNLGLWHAKGDVVAFPDDDCWYPEGVLTTVAAFLTEYSYWDGIIGNSVNEHGKANLPWQDNAGPLSPAISWRRAVTYTYFLRKEVVAQVGGFDETLGPGSGTSWGCGEDNDYMLRVLEAGNRVYFDPSLRLHHPNMFIGYDAAARDKKYRYSLGDGRVLRLHPMPLWWKLLFFGIPLMRMLSTVHRFSMDKILFHWLTFKGRVAGYLSAPPLAQQNSTQFIRRTREKP